ncbi:WD40 repeat domain-containing protein [Actinomadura madurae]|nr:WD40 repeat domain-containing protein [Actinomadura madurae]MCP9979213.1 WD40 repeat domain-containing protein [Actinomadura madurae]
MARLPADVPGAADRAVRAHRTAPTLDARSALLSIAGRQPYQYRLAGHAGMVKSVAFSPDGRELATGGQDGAVITWDPERRVPRARFASSGGAVRILEYSPDGRLLATADLGGVITLWRTSDRAPVRRMRMAGVLDGLAFSPDGRRLAAAGAARTAAVWEVATGREVGEIDGHGGLTTEVAYAPDGRTVAIAGDDGRVALWRPDDDRVRTVEVGDALLTAVAFSPDGRSLAAAGDDDEVHLLDLESGEERGPARRMQHTDTISALAFTDGGRTLVSSAYDRTVKLWETASRTNITTLTGHSGGIYDIAVSPGGNRIASAALDQTTLVWDLRRTPYIGHTDWVNDIALDPGGKGFASVGQDGSLRWWDTASRRPAATVSAHPRGAAVVDHGSGLVVTGGDDALIHIWRDRRRVGTLRGHTDKIYALDLAPDGRTLAAADQSGALILWDVPTRRRTAVLKRGRPLVKGLAFGPDGRMLATGDDDRAVTLWDVGRRRRTAVLPGHPGRVASIAISPDGRLLAAGGGGGEVLLWDLRHRRRAGGCAATRPRYGRSRSARPAAGSPPPGSTARSSSGTLPGARNGPSSRAIPTWSSAWTSAGTTGPCCPPAETRRSPPGTSTSAAPPPPSPHSAEPPLSAEDGDVRDLAEAHGVERDGLGPCGRRRQVDVRAVRGVRPPVHGGRADVRPLLLASLGSGAHRQVGLPRAVGDAEPVHPLTAEDPFAAEGGRLDSLGLAGRLHHPDQEGAVPVEGVDAQPERYRLADAVAAVGPALGDDPARGRPELRGTSRARRAAARPSGGSGIPGLEAVGDLDPPVAGSGLGIVGAVLLLLDQRLVRPLARDREPHLPELGRDRRLHRPRAALREALVVAPGALAVGVALDRHRLGGVGTLDHLLRDLVEDALGLAGEPVRVEGEQDVAAQALDLRPGTGRRRPALPVDLVVEVLDDGLGSRGGGSTAYTVVWPGSGPAVPETVGPGGVAPGGGAAGPSVTATPGSSEVLPGVSTETCLTGEGRAGNQMSDSYRTPLVKNSSRGLSS